MTAAKASVLTTPGNAAKKSLATLVAPYFTEKDDIPHDEKCDKKRSKSSYDNVNHLLHHFEANNEATGTIVEVIFLVYEDIVKGVSFCIEGYSVCSETLNGGVFCYKMHNVDIVLITRLLGSAFHVLLANNFYFHFLFSPLLLGCFFHLGKMRFVKLLFSLTESANKTALIIIFIIYRTIVRLSRVKFIFFIGKSLSLRKSQSFVFFYPFS